VKVALPLIALLIAVAVLPAERSDLRRLRLALVVGGAAIGAYAAALIVSGAGLPAQGVSERFSLAAEGAGNPNQLAAALLLPLMAALDVVMDPWPGQARRERIVGVVGLVLTTIAIVLSGSRGGVAAAVVSFAAALLLYSRWRPWSRARVRSVVAVTVAAAVVVVTIALTIWAVFPTSRAAAIVFSDPVRRLTASETGASGRTEIWTGGLVACRSHCAFGAGIGGFRDAYSDAFPFSGATRNVGGERPAHNVYLEMAVELGVVGLVLFAVAVSLEWWTVRRFRDVVLAPAVAAAVVGVLVTDVFEGFLWLKHAWLPFVVLRVIENASAPSPGIGLGALGELPRPSSLRLPTASSATS
jgi:O-antigen ligase